MEVCHAFGRDTQSYSICVVVHLEHFGGACGAKSEVNGSGQLSCNAEVAASTSALVQTKRPLVKAVQAKFVAWDPGRGHLISFDLCLFGSGRVLINWNLSIY